MSYKLGLSREYSFTDIWSLEEEDLEFIPKNVAAVVFLFPADDIPQDQGSNVSDLVFIKQTIPNACGTIALLHALTNNAEIVDANSDFIFDLVKLDPSERPQFLEKSSKLKEIHSSFAVQGQTIGEEVQTNLHFVCFIQRNGIIYELDGRLKGPKEVSKVNKSLLVDSCHYIKQVMLKDPKEVNFTTLALVKE